MKQIAHGYYGTCLRVSKGARMLQTGTPSVKRSPASFPQRTRGFEAPSLQPYGSTSVCQDPGSGVSSPVANQDHDLPLTRTFIALVRSILSK